ncbi:M24 family metallopeptidase [Deinococcus sp. Marseille-Q6407]|uniref:M24 family metallopeptidase n=1 Tax=Deinococcus sp. Marseille-Q6407 TaxID=2969223 RepID=UPI0021C02717|nr:M24 family metallopeptidase [Deinococcus sp. Marseille-Q6407]
MTDPLAEIRAALHSDAGAGLDGWLLYDFQGLNPQAWRVLNLPAAAHLTRRFFVWVPREGRALVLHNHIEEGTWRRITADWDTDYRAFGSYTELEDLLAAVVGGKVIAMEYSPQGAVPYVSRVDAGTLERVRLAGAEVQSSADLLQTFLRWSEDDLSAHRRAAAVLMEAKDAAFRLLHERLQAGKTVTELDAQAVIHQHIAAAGMHWGHEVNVSFGANAADPHYQPEGEVNAALQLGQCVLIDLWCAEEGRPYSDVTWVGYAGEPTAEYLDAWAAVRSGRDAAVELLQSRWPQVQGWEADRRAREAMGETWAPYLLHRLGHDLGTDLHGAGANLDDYETHDTRRLTPGLGVTVEPGVYPRERGFGIRSEINLYLAANGPEITTDLQREPFRLGGPESWEEVRARAYGAADSA